MTFPPALPLSASPVLLFGVLLLAGLIGGELAQRVLRLPRLTGYVLMGVLLGASGLGLIDEAVLAEAAIFIDIALGLILFDLGQRLNLGWLVRERWLLATGLAESALAFGAIYAALVYFEVRPLYAAVAAAIGVSTSPAIVMVMARELKAEGQVTERALHLVAIDSVIAFMLATMLLSWIHHEYQAGWLVAALHPLYLLAGSLASGYFGALGALGLVRLVGKHAESQFVVLVGVVVVLVGAARVLELSVLLALLAFGVLVRTLDRRHDLLPIETGRMFRLFVVVLFLVAGASVPLSHLAAGGGLALVYVIARFVGKSLAVLVLAPFSGVRRSAAGLLCLALTPMSGIALAMVQSTARLYPDLGAQVSPIVLSSVLVLELIGPIAVQFALRAAREAREEPAR